MTNIPQIALSTLRVLEGLPGTNGKPALAAYLDSASIPTIGFGHTAGVRMGMRCTEAQATAWLHDDATEAAQAVERYVTVSLNDNQRAALICFTFNNGVEAFRTSTLLRVLNEGKYEQVPVQMQRWIYAKKRDASGKVVGKVVVNGLVNRRNAEVSLWLTPSLIAVRDVPASAFANDTAGVSAITPPQPSALLDTSTGKAGVASVVTGGAAAAIQAAQQAEPVLSAFERVTALTAGVPDILRLLAVVLVVGCIGFTGWMLYERIRKLQEDHK